MPKRKTIQFLLPGAGIAGGIKVVYQYANFLHEQGHVVRILYPGKVNPNTRSLRWKFEAPLRNAKYGYEKLRGKSEGSWFPLKVSLIRKASLEAKYIPDADITIATGNETADWVALLPERCGEKFYFIQGYEDWLRNGDELHATYKLPLKKITISSKLREQVQHYTDDPIAIVSNGIDSKVFFNESIVAHQPPRILMLSHQDALKGIPDGFDAVARVRSEMPEVILSMFGVSEPRSDIPSDTEYHYRPSQEALRQLYASSDIFLAPSHKEGFGLPAAEAMSCGCAVVATNVGGVPEYIEAGKTGFVVEPGDIQGMSEAVLKLLGDPELLARVRAAGQASIQQNFSLQESAAHFEQALLSDDTLK